MAFFPEPQSKPFLYVSLIFMAVIFIAAFICQFIGCDLFTFWNNPYFFIEPRVRIYG